jgi:probable F420-dependent oxidoreductase
VDLGRVGLWTRQLDARPAAEAQETVAELESLGYPAVWIPEAVDREVLTHAALLLAGTATIVVATGIARVHARNPRTAALAQLMLTERFPNRFLFGLGAGHPLTVERLLGRDYGPPLAVMSEYLDAVDAVVAGRNRPLDVRPARVLAALGPRMLDLAARRSLGAHTYLAPVDHSAWARDVLGPDALLAPALKVVLDRDPDRARQIGRWSVGPPTSLPAYRTNLERFGFADTELGRNPSDRVVDALVAWGDETTIAARVRDHLDAGADHVCVEVLTGDDRTVPLDAWRRLAPALAEVR